VAAILTAIEKSEKPVQVFNLGTDQYCTVRDSIGWICGHLGLNPRIDFTGGNRGWIGDSPFIFLDCSRVRSLGWAPVYSIERGVLNTIAYLERNQGLLRERT
jgi:UDP-glucose 4-epimerase